MKKTLSIILAAAMALCLCVPAMAAGSHTVTIINGMDGSVAETFTVADGEDFVFSISCAAPADMGPVAEGELGSGVTTTEGTITYSNITTGGPNAYPTAETVTISGITKDATVTVTPNPDEVDSVFPTITEGELAGGASGETSGEASSDEPYPMFEEYKEYLYETLMQDAFWQGNEENLRAGLDAAETPDDESIQNFTGSGDVDQAPAGVVFPMTYDAWYAENGGASGEAKTVEEAYVEYIHEFLLAELEINSSMTIEQIEDEFMPLVEAGDYVSFPADMLYSGMLNSGPAMTFEEFEAQYVPENTGSAGGAAMDEREAFDGYVEYLREYMTSYDGEGDGSGFDEGARTMAIGELDTVAFGSDVNAFPFEMFVTQFGALTYDEWLAAQ